MRPRLFDAAPSCANILVLVIVLAILPAACAGGRVVTTTPAASGAIDVSDLWQEPTDLETRDLLVGPGGAGPRPDSPVFTLVKTDMSGHSPGYDVRDQNGVEWSVKLGSEAQTEVVTSRILWAIGYHQMPTYYLTRWQLDQRQEGDPGPGRFRPVLPNAKVVDEWSWYENPFAHTQPFRGLIVANLIVNNWDWKTSNNKIYEISNPDGTVQRRYVVRDLGASFGKADAPPLTRVLGARIAQGSRNDLDDFELQRLIKSVDGDRVTFDYSGIYQVVVDTVTPGDVVWACRLLSRLSDEQWNAAFTAGGYPPDKAARFIAKLKSKIAEGLALQTANGQLSAAKADVQ